MSLKNKKTLDVYERVAKNYLKNNKLSYNERITKENKKIDIFIKETLKSIPKKSKVLEVGSADGRIANYIKKLGFDITSSDIAKDFLEAIKESGLTPIKFNILIDDFKEKYTCILCWRVFVHFTKKDSLIALSKSYDALEDNGLFIFNVINRECKEVNSEWVDFPDVYHLGEERYFNYYSKNEMDKIISKTNFRIIDSHDFIAESGVKWLVYVLKKEV